MEEPFTQAMRHALILAGSSGLRLWPMSRERRPKQLVPILNGRSLLAAAAGRLEDVVATENRYVCVVEQHRAATCIHAAYRTRPLAGLGANAG